MKKNILVVGLLLFATAAQLSAREFFVNPQQGNQQDDQGRGGRDRGRGDRDRGGRDRGQSNNVSNCNYTANYSIYVGFTHSNIPQPTLQGAMNSNGLIEFQLPEQQLITGQSVQVTLTKTCMDNNGSPMPAQTLIVIVSPNGGDTFNF